MAKKKNSKNSTPALQRSCGCLQSHFGLLDTFPEFRANQSKIERFTQKCLLLGDAAMRSGVIKIPIVVHVVYKTNSENISINQVKSQISSLNKDFRAKNADVKKVPAHFKDYVGDAGIEFYLAELDPNGKETSGITRTKTTRDSFSHVEDDVKSSTTGGADAWDSKKFLNIWVCNLSGGILGYAQFPGGPQETDGVVVRDTAFGIGGSTTSRFNKGRTTTHEIGHFLNLSHIWGESRFANCTDTDFVDDTPNQFDKHFGKPNGKLTSCDNAPNGDMYMNYMDYVDDAAMFMFTQDQVARMAATLAGPRSELGS